MFLKIFKTFSFGIRRDLLHRTWPYKWVDARTLAKKHGLNWFREWFLYITPALVRTFLYITHNSHKIAAWVYIVWRTFVFLIFTLHVKLLKSLESSKTELLGPPKMTLGFMMNPNEPHWGSSWTPMNPKVYGIHDFKKFSIATFPDRKMNDYSRIPNCWHDRIETRRWRRSRDSDSFWSHFRIVSKHVLICISMWSFGT